MLGFGLKSHQRYKCKWSISNCSSECSDGEWSTSLPTYFDVTVKDKCSGDQSSGDESWETLPGKEEQREPEVQSDSSSSSGEEEHNEFAFQAGYVVLFQAMNFDCCYL